MASKSDWEGDLGRTWGDATAVMDRMLAPFGQAALDQLGEGVNENQVFRMIAEADPENTGQLSFYQFR